MNDVFFIALRRLRAPLILIIIIFSVATVGLTLIPGVDENGNEWFFTPFEAFYFVSYMATTIGFGETPRPFTDVQRLWVTFIIYLSVVGWAYLLGTLLGLVQDKGFQQAIVSAQFRRAIKRMRQPFYIICGLGETGLSVLSTLDRQGFLFVVIDSEATRLHELQIQDHSADAPALAADARSPDVLLAAGLKKKECLGLLALTNNDDVNLAIAINVHLLRPELPIICRSQSPEKTQMLSLIGAQQIIDPFQEFSEQLLMAIKSPDTHRLMTWLVGPPGSYLKPRLPAPPGAWIVCGYGRFGTKIADAIRHGGFEVTVIDPAPASPNGVHFIKDGGASENVLFLAGVREVAGIVAGTNNDAVNLAIAITARKLNPDIFIIARQNIVSNAPLFQALSADMTMISNQIIANECVAILQTPLLAEFLRIVRRKDNSWSHRLVRELGAITKQVKPTFWSFRICPEDTPGLFDMIHRADAEVRLSDIRRDIGNRAKNLRCYPLLLIRNGEPVELPQNDLVLKPEDRLLFAGLPAARNRQRDILLNANVARSVIAGESGGESLFWKWLTKNK